MPAPDDIIAPSPAYETGITTSTRRNQRKVQNNGYFPDSSRGPVSDEDMMYWRNEFSAVLAKPGETFNSRTAAGANDWTMSLFGCLVPIDLCLVSLFLPCITFGKTHHRINKSSDMQGYEPVNTSCLLFCGSSIFGLQWILEALQRAEVRSKYNLEGSCLGDLALSCCCSFCMLVQLEKESEHREKLLRVSNQQEAYKSNEDMVYPEVVPPSGGAVV